MLRKHLEAAGALHRDGARHAAARCTAHEPPDGAEKEEVGRDIHDAA